MKKEKTDLRIVKTRKAIKEAFLKLIDSKGYDRMTIQDIADEAMINRNTFYLHYVDKIDLMESLCQDSIEQLNVCIHLETKGIEEMNVALFTTILMETFRVIESDLAFFKAMLSENGYPNFANHLKESLKSLMLTGLEKKQFTSKSLVALEYMISGLVGVICMWITDSEKLEVHEIVDQLSEIHFHNVLKLLQQQAIEVEINK